jgi:ketosteroid isomerase-like protein
MRKELSMSYVTHLSAMLLIAATLGGCSRSEQAPEAVPSFEALLNSGNAARTAEWFTEDAALLPENLRRVSGKSGILQYYTDLASADLTYRVEAAEMMADRKLAVSEGTYRVHNVKTNKEVEKGKYLAVLKHVDKGWRIHRLMMNTDESPPKTTVTVDAPTSASSR